MRFAERMTDGLANLTFSERQQVLRLLVEDVTLRDDHAVVRTIIPTDGTKGESSLCTPVQGRVGGWKTPPSPPLILSLPKEMSGFPPLSS